MWLPSLRGQRARLACHLTAFLVVSLHTVMLDAKNVYEMRSFTSEAAAETLQRLEPHLPSASSTEYAPAPGYTRKSKSEPDGLKKTQFVPSVFDMSGAEAYESEAGKLVGEAPAAAHGAVMADANSNVLQNMTSETSQTKKMASPPLATPQSEEPHHTHGFRPSQVSGTLKYGELSSTYQDLTSLNASEASITSRIWQSVISRVRSKERLGDRLTMAAGGPLPEAVMPNPSLADVIPAARIEGEDDKVVVLLHGGIQGGWVWLYPRPELGAPRGVRGLLEEQGYRVYTPTLPYHEPYTKWNASYPSIQASDYVDAIVELFEKHGLENAILVGHSLSGVWLQLTLQRIPHRISKLVFCDAAVLADGESFATNLVGQPGQLGFAGFASYPFFPYALNIGSTSIPDFRGRVDLFVWEDLLMSDFRGNDTLIYDTYAKLVPEPRRPMLQTFDLKDFYTIPMPKQYIWLMRDIGLPIPSSWLGFVGRLEMSNTAGSPVQVFAVDADHEAMLSSPDKLVSALIQAFGAP
eukprot:jgi/Botrbrau1/16290/Bobra.0066s0062.4